METVKLLCFMIFLVQTLLAAPTAAVALSLRDFAPPNTADWTPALKAAAQEAVATGDHVIDVPPGAYYFRSPVPMLNQVTIRCAPGAILIRGYSGDFLMWYGTGGGVRDCTLMAAAGTTGGAAVKALATEAWVAGYLTFRDLVIVGPGVWAFNVMLDGSQRATPPAGVRQVMVDNVVGFGATVAGVYVYNGVTVNVRGGGYYGSAAHIYVLGWPEDGRRYSWNVTVDTVANGWLIVCNAWHTRAQGSFADIWTGCDGDGVRE